MKKLFTILLPLVLTLASCKQEGCMDATACNYDDEALKDDGTCNYGCNTGGGGDNGGGGSGGSGGGGGSTSGQVTFWNDQSSVGQITVYMGGTSSSITSNIQPGSCNTSGCANFSGSAGSYAYTASATTGQSWAGSVTVTSGGCMLLYLYD